MKKILLLAIMLTCSLRAAPRNPPGQPENLAMCTDTSSGCFDLTVNDDAVTDSIVIKT